MYMNKSPLVTVILSVYQESLSHLDTALQSIVAQTHFDFECIIIIDDPENTSAIEYVKNLSLKDTRFRYLVHKKSRGLAVCRNEAIQQATGRYVALMDADDIMKENRLARQLDYCELHEVDGVFSHAMYIDEDGKEMNAFTPEPVESLPHDIFKRHMFVHPTGFFKTELLQANPYDESLQRSQDLELWLRLVRLGYKLAIVPEILLMYRLYPNASLEKRIKRQRGYSKYGLQVALGQFKFFWRYIVYYRFLVSRLLYWCVTHLPSWLLKPTLQLKTWSADQKNTS